MAQAGIGWAGPDVEQQQIDRQRMMAQQLMKQGETPLQGQNVSGHYIAPHWTQQLAQALSSPLGDMVDKRTDERQQAYADKLRTQGMQDIQDFTKAGTGTPASTMQPLTPNDDNGNVNPQIDVAAQGPDRNRQLAIALGSRNPMLQQAGGSMLASMMPKAAEWAEFKRPDGQGGSIHGFVNKNAPNPLDTFQAGGTMPAKLEAVNTGGSTSFVNPYAPKAEGAPTIGATPNPFKDKLVRGADGNPVINMPMLDYGKQVANAGKPQISVDARNFNTQESEQSKAYGKQLGEMRGNITQAGFDAPKKIAQLDRMEELLKGVDGGAAAPAIADLAGAAQSFGIKLDPKLGNKQAAEALAIGMAQAMRQPGTGPMTDRDMDQFIKQVPGLAKTAEGRAEITKTIRASIERDQRASKFASEYAAKNGGVIDDNYMNAVSDFYAKNPVVTPKMPTTNARGQAFKDPGKEQRYQEYLRSQGQK